MVNRTRGLLICVLVALTITLVCGKTENSEGEPTRTQTTAALSDFQLLVSDSSDLMDEDEGKKHRLEFGKKLPAGVTAKYFQHLFLEWKVKGSAGKAIQVHQAFVRMSNEKIGRDYIIVAESSTKGYNAHINLRTAANEFFGQSGDYQIQIIVGDVSVSNPIQWNIGTIRIDFPPELTVEVPRSPFAVLPEIKHQFRKPESRPPMTVSSAFTIATVAIPFLVLFVGLKGVGANLGNFPTGSDFIWAIGFQGCVGAVLTLYLFYWLSLNMMQTLGYLALLALPTLFFAHKNLNALSRVKQHAE